MRVAAFTPGAKVPSARFRVRQFVEPLASMGIDLHEFSTLTSSYPPAGLARRAAWSATRLGELAVAALRSWSYDCVVLQREMISSLVTLEPLTRTPRVLDVDDSIHLLRDGRSARKLAEISDWVIAGNDWLAEWYGRWNRNVVILPTAVDTDVYRPAAEREQRDTVEVGWIGTSANYVHLAEVEEALRLAFELLPQMTLKVVGDRPPDLRRLDPARWTFRRWDAAREVADIQSMDIGIMPLSADQWGDWARGKCSFKMLQYMSSGLPVIVSPVGMNASVLAQGQFGIGATRTQEWVDGFYELVRSPALRAKLGAEGRAIVERHYARSVVASGVAGVLRQAAGVSARGNPGR